MYLAEYDDPQLAGFFSKVWKKVGRPLVHVAAAVVSGGATIPLSIAVEQQRAQKKMAEEQARMQEQQMREWNAMQPQVLPPQGQPLPVSHAQPTTTMLPGSPFPITNAPQTMMPAQPQSPTAWVAPVAAVAAVVAAAAALSNRRGRR